MTTDWGKVEGEGCGAGKIFVSHLNTFAAPQGYEKKRQRPEVSAFVLNAGDWKTL